MSCRTETVLNFNISDETEYNDFTNEDNNSSKDKKTDSKAL